MGHFLKKEYIKMLQDYNTSSSRLFFIRPRFLRHRSPFSPRSDPSLLSLPGPSLYIVSRSTCCQNSTSDTTLRDMIAGFILKPQQGNTLHSRPGHHAIGNPQFHLCPPNYLFVMVYSRWMTSRNAMGRRIGLSYHVRFIMDGKLGI
ncbi:hypothetical protein TNCV_5052841 [Trichonephila clavipes]|nr:hypothetical protein TNCV_5052841 [Trichonephila clavipes]